MVMQINCGLQDNAIGLERSSGSLELEFSRQAVRRFYQSGSAKAFLPLSHGEAMEVIFANTAGGLADGDVFSSNLNVVNESNLIATTQAAERVYRALGRGRASSHLVFNVAGNSKLCWLPHETILYDGSHFSRRIEVSVDKSSCFVLGEIVVFGRQASGEVMTKGQLQDHWRIKRDGRLIHAEAFRMDGDIDRVLGHRAGAGEAGVMATLLMVRSEDLNPLMTTLSQLPTPDGAQIEVSSWEGKLVARILAPTLYQIKPSIGAMLEKMISSTLPRTWAL